MAYSYQTYTYGQVATATELQQTEDNARDHIHGSSSVAASMQNITVTGSLSADYVHANSGNFIQGLLVAGATWYNSGSSQTVNSGQTIYVIGSASTDTHSAWHDVSSITVPGGFNYARASLHTVILGGHNNAFMVGVKVGSSFITGINGGYGNGYAPNSAETYWNATGGIPATVITPISKVKSGDIIQVFTYANDGVSMSLGDLNLAVEFFR